MTLDNSALVRPFVPAEDDERAGQRTIAVRISRADLADWIKRTGTKP